MPASQNGQTHSNNSLALANCLIVLDHFVRLPLKGLNCLFNIALNFFVVAVFVDLEQNLVRTQNFPKNWYLIPPDTFTFQEFSRRTKWMVFWINNIFFSKTDIIRCRRHGSCHKFKATSFCHTDDLLTL